MDTTNSFKKLLEEDEWMFPPPPDIEENVMGSLKILSIMGEAMELYIPRVLEMFVLTLGGTIRQIEQTAKEDLSYGAPGVDQDNSTPSGSAGDDSADEIEP